MKKHNFFVTIIICLSCLSGVNRVNAQYSSLIALLAGNGTSWDPYQITDTLDLKTLSVLTNIYGDSTIGKYFKLMNDIDMTNIAWTPIGKQAFNYFCGNFDGNGKVIRNLTCKHIGVGCGFFGILAGATVENLGIENCDVGDVYSSSGGLAVESIASYISNCYVTGNITGSGCAGGLLASANSCNYISNCYFLGNVSVSSPVSNGVGGLVGLCLGVCNGGGDGNSGYHPSIISNCYVTGKVSAIGIYNYSPVGGLVGLMSGGIIRDCVIALDSLTTDENTAYINRIVGRTDSYYLGVTLQHNYALNTMVVQDSSGNVPIISNLNTECGMDIPMDSLKSFSFYNTFSNWYQMPWSIQNHSGIWKICDGQDLPFLRYQGIICSYNIIATAGAGGTINPTGIINVEDTASQVFTFTPNTCYEIDSLWIDSVYFPDSIAAGSYTFNNITQNHTIEVNFKRLPPDTVTISDTICYGKNYKQNNFNITNATTDSVYFNNDFNTNGCDSVTRLELTVNPLIITQISDSICDGNFYDFHGDSLTASGIYYDILPAIFGCDSIIELTLTVHSIDTTQILIDICEGDSCDFFGRQLTEEGVYYQTLQSIHGCDSIIELTLTVEGVGIVGATHALPLRIYPNPTDGKLIIESEELKIETIEIVDITGQVIKTYNLLINNTVDISELPNAMYFITFHSEGQKITKKLVKY